MATPDRAAAPLAPASGARRQLLFLTQRLPYPPIKGEKIRPLRILRYLARHFDIHLGCLIDDPADREHIPTIAALCRDIHVAEIDPRRAKILCTRGLLTGEALSVTFFADRGLAAWVRRVMDDVRPDIVFVNSGNMAPYVLGQKRAGRMIVDLADVDSEKWRAYADTAGFPMRHVYRREWRKVAALERAIAAEADVASFVSTPEAALFRQLVPGSRADVRGVTSGVDDAYFDPAIPHDAPYDTAPAHYVFTGTMDYRPNVDAVTWFAREMLPELRARLGDARFHIVGNNPAPEVRALATLPGVNVTGRVPDVRPYLQHCTAAVAPMRIARGIQNKVLEAMAMARPVVVTPDGLEGIDAVPGQDVVLAADTPDFIAACHTLATPGAGDAIATAARRYVVTNCDWEARLAAFDDVLGLR
jgi:polysaccharide biosynthesis protein PslH